MYFAWNDWYAITVTDTSILKTFIAAHSKDSVIDAATNNLKGSPNNPSSYYGLFYIAFKAFQLEGYPREYCEVYANVFMLSQLGCYDCLYDLEITITDDCNNQHLPNGKPFDTVLHNFSVIDTTCAGGAAGFSFSFTQYLLEGSYDVTKRLSVSRSGMNYYRDSIFTKRNTCQSASSIILQQKQLQAMVSQCKPSCQNCTDSLGTWSTFQARYMLNAGISPTDSAS